MDAMRDLLNNIRMVEPPRDNEGENNEEEQLEEWDQLQEKVSEVFEGCDLSWEKGTDFNSAGSIQAAGLCDGVFLKEKSRKLLLQKLICKNYLEF